MTSEKEFDLGRTVTLQLFSEPEAGGTIQINTIEPNESPWTGKYFQNETISLRAKAQAGFQFVGWTIPELGSSPEVSLPLKDDLRIGATFKQMG